MKTVNDIQTVMDMGTLNPAKIMKINDYGLNVGCNANLNVFDGTDFYDIFVNNKIRKQVYSFGNLVAVSWCEQMIVP
jgi:cytosine/adenosine deaminase-related metal-dependent hydrolase